jgi:hypothetical protein
VEGENSSREGCNSEIGLELQHIDDIRGAKGTNLNVEAVANTRCIERTNQRLKNKRSEGTVDDEDSDSDAEQIRQTNETRKVMA